MLSNSDSEKVWFLYKTEGEPKGVSINSFCVNQGVPYNQFNDWFRKTSCASNFKMTYQYRIDWKNLVAVLESPVIRSIRMN